MILGWPPETWLVGILGAGLVCYALFGGADFGVGIWDLFLGLQSSDDERHLSHKAMGPVWETNHVWLIFVFVILWTAFPKAFTGLCQVLWAPLFFGLLGIVFRGAAYAFAAGHDEERETWTLVFAFASNLTPFAFGYCIGALCQGFPELTLKGLDNKIASPGKLLPLLIACFSVLGCAYLAAVYLIREAQLAEAPKLIQTWRRRALFSGLATGALAFIGLAVLSFEAPALWSRFLGRSWFFVLSSSFGGILTLVATMKMRPKLAIFGASLAIASVLAGWLVAQYPVLIPPHISIEDSRAPESVLKAMLGIVVLGALILLPSLALLFSIFKAGSEEEIAT